MSGFYLFTTGLLLCLSSSAQETARLQPKISLASHLLSYRFYFTDEDFTYPENIGSYIKESRFEYPSLILSIENKKGNHHELEFFNFHREKNRKVVLYYPPGNLSFEYPVPTYSFEIGYSYLWYFLENKSRNFRLILGAGASGFYENALFESKSSSSFSIRYHNIHSYLNLISGVQYQPFEKVYFRFTVPLSWRIYGHIFEFIDNPTLTDDARHSDYSSRQIASYIPERLGIQLGLGYVF